MPNQQTGVCTASVVKAEGPNFSTLLSIIKVKVDELSPTCMSIVIAITLSNKVPNWPIRILDPYRIGALLTAYARNCSARVDAFGHPRFRSIEIARLVSKVDLASHLVSLRPTGFNLALCYVFFANFAHPHQSHPWSLRLSLAA